MKEAIHTPTWSDIIRFMAKVRVDANGCWNWTGTRLGRAPSYGGFSMRSVRHIYAHRWAFFVTYGPIPEGLQIDHLCKNVLCVNPAHLEAVTPRENTLRSTARSARNAQKTHCKNGHEFTNANTYVWADKKTGRSYRICRACFRKPFRKSAKREEVNA